MFADDTMTLSLAENTDSGRSPDVVRKVGDPITATDADGDTLNYYLSGDDAGLFDIRSRDSAYLNLRAGQLRTWHTYFDYETGGVAPTRSHWTESTTPKFRAGPGPYNVTITARDPSGATDTINVTINITDVTEPVTVKIQDADTPLIGTELSASLAGDVPVERNTVTWQWARAKQLSGGVPVSPVAITGATSSTYTPTTADLGQFLSAQASYTHDGSASTINNRTSSRVGCESVSFSGTQLRDPMRIMAGLAPGDDPVLTPERMLRVTSLGIGTNVRVLGAPTAETGGTNPTYQMYDYNLTNTTGLSCAVNLKHLTLEGHTSLTSIDLSTLYGLETLSVAGSGLTSIDLTSNTELTVLNVQGQGGEGRDADDNKTGLTTLTVPSNLDKLVRLHAAHNAITTTNLHNNMSHYGALVYVDLGDNELTGQFNAGDGILRYLYLEDNQLTSLLLTELTAIGYVTVYGNPGTAGPAADRTFTIETTRTNSEVIIAWTAAERRNWPELNAQIGGL